MSKTGSLDECLNELVNNDIKKPGENLTFFKHFFTQHFQQKMFQECKNKLKCGEVLLLQDFSRNRDIKHQDEIKSSYWSTKQASCHPTVIWWRDPDTQKLLRLAITHLSDITNHDAMLVHHITKDCMEILSTRTRVQWTKIYIWSDGCASQYKGKHSFFFLQKLKIPAECHFFGSEHGKSESDAETGIISKKLNNAIKSRSVVINNASEMQLF